MCTDAAISDIAMRQKSFWEIFSHRRFCRSMPWGIPLKAPAQRKAGLASRSVARCSFSRCAERGVWKMGFQFVFPFFFSEMSWILATQDAIVAKVKGFVWNPGIPKVWNLGFDLTHLVLDDLPPSSCSTCSALTSWSCHYIGFSKVKGRKGCRFIHPWRIINGWNIIPWRFGSDHFPF